MRFRALCLLLLVGVLFLSVVGVASVSADLELAYDDGRFDTEVILQNYYDTALHRTHLRQKFVLSDFPWLPKNGYWVKEVKVCWGDHSGNVLDTVKFDIRLRDEDGIPITVLRDLVSPPSATWHIYDVSGARFISDSYFYVELIAKAADADYRAEYVAAVSDQPECSEYSTDENGDAWTPEAELHYGIRVFVSKLGPVPELSLSIPIVTSIATVAYLAIRKRISRKLE